MATTPTVLTFSPVASTIPGQPVSFLANNPNPPIVGLVAPPAPDPAAINTAVGVIQLAIADDKAANTAGTTPAPAPVKFSFTDLAVNVSSTTPGDVYKGTTAGITAQFIDLTPDNLLIQATAANLFMKSDTGNDIMTAASGTNILSAGAGLNTMVGGSGKDTFLADATKASASETILNFHAGDNAAMMLKLTDFKFTVLDTFAGLEFDATPNAVTNPIAAHIVLQGFKVADIGTKLSLGAGTTADGTAFIFLHGNG